MPSCGVPVCTFFANIWYIAAFQCLKKVYRKDRDRLFTNACSDITRGRSRFRLDLRTKHLTVRVVRYWNNFSRMVVEHWKC